MTIGQRIRYFRKRLGITQDDLAKRAELHPVSIRKYETDKMVPQPPQITKLANALGVSYSAISGENVIQLHLETIGDLLGLLITLCESCIVKIAGIRGEDDLIKTESAVLFVNEKISQFFAVKNVFGEDQQICSLLDFAATFNDEQLLEKLLLWEREHYKFTSMRPHIVVGENTEDPEYKKFLAVADKKERLELELRSSMERIPGPMKKIGGIYVP